MEKRAWQGTNVGEGWDDLEGVLMWQGPGDWVLGDRVGDEGETRMMGTSHIHVLPRSTQRPQALSMHPFL